MMMRIEQMFQLPIDELTGDERFGCLLMYAFYFNRDGLSEEQALEVVNGWVLEFGSDDAAITALRARVDASKATA